MENKLERVALNELRQGRRGKHNKLVTSILDEMSTLPDGEALKVPIAAMKDVSIQNVRAAVVRPLRVALRLQHTLTMKVSMFGTERRKQNDMSGTLNAAERH